MLAVVDDRTSSSSLQGCTCSDRWEVTFLSAYATAKLKPRAPQLLSKNNLHRVKRAVRFSRTNEIILVQTVNGMRPPTNGRFTPLGYDLWVMPFRFG